MSMSPTTLLAALTWPEAVAQAAFYVAMGFAIGVFWTGRWPWERK